MEAINNNIITDEDSFSDNIGAPIASTSRPFIEANTVPISFEELTEKHIIPVYVKDNERLISQSEFIEMTYNVTTQAFPAERILRPSIRLSHPIKGRVPTARNKTAIDLQEHEKTLYYERMAFVIEIPSIQEEVDGNRLSLVVGGVKAYNLDNLYARKGSDEHFKVFIGFKNQVCTNLCIWTDGLQSELKVKNAGQLEACILSLLTSYSASGQLDHLKQLADYSLTEQQFALLIGRCRMFPHIGKRLQGEITPLKFGDTQINAVVNDYYKDSSFCRMGNGDINLWRVYNLLTSANKSTYIDNFLDKSVSAFNLVDQIKGSLKEHTYNWYLS